MAEPTIDFVMGKGGVGRTATSIMLARKYAEKGDKTIIVECNGSTDVTNILNRSPGGYEPLLVSNNVWVISVSAMAAIEDYVVKELKLRKLYTLIFENKLLSPLIEAAPGLHDAIQLGKVYDLHKQGHWDRIIVDCPATGHGLSLISAAKTMMGLSRAGPLYNQNSLVESVISAHGRIVLVTLLEELPAKETCELYDALPADLRSKSRIVFNRVHSVPNSWEELSKNTASLETLKQYPNHSRLYQLWLNQSQQQNEWSQWLEKRIPCPKFWQPTSVELTFTETSENAWQAPL